MEARSAWNWRRIGGVAVFTSAAGLCMATSLWQYKRSTQKQLIIHNNYQQFRSPPLLAKDLASVDSLTSSFRRVQLQGHFLTDQVQLVGPRASAPKQNGAGGGAGANGLAPSMFVTGGPKPSYLALAPLVTDSGDLVLVNVGLHMQGEVPQLPKGRVGVTGIVRAGDRFGYWSPKERQMPDGTWIGKDAEAMLTKVQATQGDRVQRIVPVVIEHLGIDAEPPSDIETRTSPTMHLVYSGTWATLGTALLGLTAVWARRR